MDVKAQGLTLELHSKLINSSKGEEIGISSEAVKCIDIGRNTSGEGDSLAYY